jgi:phage tail-like protein
MPDEAPFRNFNFRVEIDGLPEVQFREVVIPATRIEVVEYREGGDPLSATRKLPGRFDTGNVVLRRGIDLDLALWQWFRATREGDLDRRNVSIVLLDAERREVRRWRVERAWPAAYAFSPLHGHGNEVVIETLELACERVDVES